MIAGGTECRDTTYLHVDAAACNPHSHDAIRADLAAGRIAHMAALQAAIAAGFPGDELNHSEESFARITREMRLICQAQGVEAPMVLAALA